MPSQEEVDDLKRRIAELEQELARERAAHAEALAAAVREDQARAEFNPG